MITNRPINRHQIRALEDPSPSVASAECDERMPIDDAQALAWWCKFFLPHELVLIFFLDRQWSIYDPARAVHIADTFRKMADTKHNNAVIQSLLGFFRSQPNFKLLNETMMSYQLPLVNSFIHLVPYTDICPLCEERLSAKNSHSRQVNVICERGRVVTGKFIEFPFPIS